MRSEECIAGSALLLACARLSAHRLMRPIGIRNLIREQVATVPDDEPMTPERRDRIALALVCEEIANYESEVNAHDLEKMFLQDILDLMKGLNR